MTMKAIYRAIAQLGGVRGRAALLLALSVGCGGGATTAAPPESAPALKLTPRADGGGATPARPSASAAPQSDSSPAIDVTLFEAEKGRSPHLGNRVQPRVTQDPFGNQYVAYMVADPADPDKQNNRGKVLLRAYTKGNWSAPLDITSGPMERLELVAQADGVLVLWGQTGKDGRGVLRSRRYRAATGELGRVATTDAPLLVPSAWRVSEASGSIYIQGDYTTSQGTYYQPDRDSWSAFAQGGGDARFVLVGPTEIANFTLIPKAMAACNFVSLLDGKWTDVAERFSLEGSESGLFASAQDFSSVEVPGYGAIYHLSRHTFVFERASHSWRSLGLGFHAVELGTAKGHLIGFGQAGSELKINLIEPGGTQLREVRRIVGRSLRVAVAPDGLVVATYDARPPSGGQTTPGPHVIAFRVEKPETLLLDEPLKNLGWFTTAHGSSAFIYTNDYQGMRVRRLAVR